MMEKKITVLKLSLLNTVEETREAIAQAMGIPVENVVLSPEQIAQIESKGKDRLQIRELIAPFYDPIEQAPGKQNAKKRKELIDIGHFLYFLNNGTRLIECGERPDFVVELEGKKVGVELTDLTDEELAAQVTILKKIFTQATEILRGTCSATGLFNISIDPGKINFNGKSIVALTKDERSKLAGQIASYIQHIMVGNHTEIPSYIDGLVTVSHNVLEIVASEPYFAQKYSEDKFVSVLQKKQKKFEAYRQESGLEQFWLLIVINGVTAESNIDITPEMLPVQHHPVFDRVYLFNFFKQTIIEGKGTSQVQS